ncbi:MAG: hypothetical protein IJ673_02725 [Treponema sp.]|nr:hypothetical protein [Treponema sp.]
MFKKLISTIAILFALSSVSVFGYTPKTKTEEANSDDYQWYEFKAKQFGKPMKFFAFKTETQRNNRAPQILNKNGFGFNEKSETITEFFDFEGGEKTVLFDEELKPIMKENGYKYALTTFKSTSGRNATTVYLYTFWYDAENDALWVFKSYK